MSLYKIVLLSLCVVLSVAQTDYEIQQGLIEDEKAMKAVDATKTVVFFDQAVDPHSDSGPRKFSDTEDAAREFEESEAGVVPVEDPDEGYFPAEEEVFDGERYMELSKKSDEERGVGGTNNRRHLRYRPT
uniref:Uncharacterized protein n=1 Tax=Cyclophora tenuis TaxID=216820 RepID=A0A7S1D7N8_CYCTE|mmetsp:Transcript_23553/g.39966  ORF Transcript_23553/g.39966 Transcript_23553/m.39966 type:complete len:130 (+) Transcript_23553:20-409(+)